MLWFSYSSSDESSAQSAGSSGQRRTGACFFLSIGSPMVLVPLACLVGDRSFPAISVQIPYKLSWMMTSLNLTMNCL